MTGHAIGADETKTHASTLLQLTQCTTINNLKAVRCWNVKDTLYFCVNCLELYIHVCGYDFQIFTDMNTSPIDWMSKQVR